MQHGNYVVDLNKDTERNQKIIPITVIGQIMAGKTSLVKSMQQNKRALNKLSSDSDSPGKLDDASKIFKTCEASVCSGAKLSFIILEARLYAILLTNYHPDHNISHYLS